MFPQAALRPPRGHHRHRHADDEPKTGHELGKQFHPFVRGSDCSRAHKLGQEDQHEHHGQPEVKQHPGQGQQLHHAPEPRGVGMARFESAPHREPRECDDVRDENDDPGGEHECEVKLFLRVAQAYGPSEKEQERISAQHKEQRATKLFDERAPLAADDVACAERRGKNQFQRPTAAVFHEAAARGEGEPDLQHTVKDECGHEIGGRFAPLVRAKDERDVEADAHGEQHDKQHDGLAACAGRDPVKRIER